MFPSLGPRLVRLCLGLFIVGQLAFLLAANLEGILPSLLRLCGQSEEEGPLPQASETLAPVTDHWAELTGQPQDWSLFAPNAYTDLSFLAVELRWDDGVHPPLLLFSANEPEQLDRYFRIGGQRLRRYESRIDVTLLVPVDGTVEDAVVSWRDRIARQVRKRWHFMHVYLRWRLAGYRQTHPEIPPPSEVRLVTRSHRLPAPGQTDDRWRSPNQQPLARWLPQADDTASDTLPIEAYNPVSQRFDTLPKRSAKP